MNAIVNNLWKGLKDLIHIWEMEMSIIFKDQGVLIFCILVPLLYPMLYTYIYTTELAREIPITVIDNSHSSLSREFIRKVDATQWVKVVSLSSDIPDAQQQIKEQRSYGFLNIPSDFSDNLVRGQQSFVGLYADMSGMLYYKGMLIAATDVSLEMNKNIRIARSDKTTKADEQLIAQPIHNEEVVLFNSQQGFATFIIPAVLMLIIQQTLLLGIGMAGGTAAERGEYSELVATSRHNRGTFHILMGRALAYFMVYAVNTAFMVCLLPWMFSLVHLSQTVDLLLFMLPYLLACIFFALTLSILMRNREMSILVFVVTSLPLLFISGVSWPGSAISPTWKAISYLFPSTAGVNGFVRLNTMGASIYQVASEWRLLWLLAVVYFVLAYLSCRIIIYYERMKERG